MATKQIMTRRQAFHHKGSEPEATDPIPFAIPGEMPPLTLKEEMRRFIREELSRQVSEQTEAESFEDADDFEIEDYEDEGEYQTQYTFGGPPESDPGYNPDDEGKPDARAKGDDREEAGDPPAVPSGGEPAEDKKEALRQAGGLDQTGREGQ